MIESPFPSASALATKGQSARTSKAEANSVHDVFARLVDKSDTGNPEAKQNAKAEIPTERPTLSGSSERGILKMFEGGALPRKDADTTMLPALSPPLTDMPRSFETDVAFADMPAMQGEYATVQPNDASTIELLHQVPSSTSRVTLNDSHTNSVFGSNMTVGLAQTTGPVSADAVVTRRGAGEPLAAAIMKTATMPLQADLSTSVPLPVAPTSQHQASIVASVGTAPIGSAHAAASLPQEVTAQVPTILRISLRPAELGPVQVVIHTGTEGTTVRIVAETDAGYAALVNKGEVLTSLVRDLRAATVFPMPDTEQQSLSFSSDGQGGGRGRTGETGHDGAERNDTKPRWSLEATGTGQRTDDSVPQREPQLRAYRTI